MAKTDRNDDTDRSDKVMALYSLSFPDGRYIVIYRRQSYINKLLQNENNYHPPSHRRGMWWGWLGYMEDCNERVLRLNVDWWRGGGGNSYPIFNQKINLYNLPNIMFLFIFQDKYQVLDEVNASNQFGL